MTRLETIMNSGTIVCELGHTVQTEDSSVFSIDYHGKDELGEYIVMGYVQTTNTNHNAIVNGKRIHAFDLDLLDNDYQKLEHLY